MKRENSKDHGQCKFRAEVETKATAKKVQIHG